MKLSYQAFNQNSKIFHKNIQNIFQLRKKSPMDINLLEDNEVDGEGGILYETSLIDDKIEKFYINKFSDDGRKVSYVDKHKVQKALDLISIEEFHDAM